MPNAPRFVSSGGLPWRERPYHRQWLVQQADRLFDFFAPASINPAGGFYDLDTKGRPVITSLRQIHATTRMVHCFSVASLLGRPGADEIVDHGMEFIWNGHRDAAHGGYLWSLDTDGPKDDSKQAYGHAFVLLAASSARTVGHPLADRVLADISEIIETRFWDEAHGAVREEFARDWSPISGYRGQNSNMHLTEALMAAFEATGEGGYLAKAERIAGLIIGRHAAALGYRVAEHFDERWSLDKDYRGADMFRPWGTTPGHWLEWARLLLQLDALGGGRVPWLQDAARQLFVRSIEVGWDHRHGGFFYTLGWDDAPNLRQKLWWPMCEGIGAASYLAFHQPSAYHEEWYRRLWGFAASHLIDGENGGWHPELGEEDLSPAETLFTGKPDIYHALQACLIPLYPATGSLTREIAAVMKG